MKFQLGDTPYKFLTENSHECDAETAFVLTKQNSKYRDDAEKNGAHSIIALGDIAPYFGVDKIKIIGITGTNGKTTTASALYSFLLDLGYKVALQGTRGFFMNDTTVEGKTLTTPSALTTYRHIYQATAEKCDFFIMEVSSHAIVQERIEGLKFELKILTNITQDHLDYHNTLEEYRAVKNSFFKDDGKKLINKDEPNADFNFKNAFTYGVENAATFKSMAYSLTGGISGVIAHFQKVEHFNSPMHGFFNLYNLMCAIAAAQLLTGKDIKEVCEVVDNFAGVSGRMQEVSKNIIVDFAHTPDGMQEAMTALREKEMRLVFGAGGDRDKSKRALMGKVASNLAKKIYLTSDNPRHEDPQAIVDDIMEGILESRNVEVYLSRREAIAKAIEEREPEEIVLILGKGDEEYQIIYDKKFPFDDREVVKEILKSL